MQARIRTRQLTLDVPTFLQRERPVSGWAGMFLSAAFEPPRRSLVRLLDRIDLDIRDGDRVALLGRNGAGKSTLLRVLNRVYQPTSGTVEVQGSCQALLNMSLGFNGEATVRENVYLRGVAMDLRSSFLRRHMDEILEFAGLQDKAGHRLRTLSSGQRLRLGFAISTSVQHDIMLMDEWVGTGDANFMARATARMQDRVSGSRIVVLASHSVGLLREVCNKGVVLEAGRLVYAGDIVESLRAYHELLAKVRDNQPIEFEDADAGPVQVMGAVEEIALAAGGGQVLLKGWMVDSQGRVPDGLVLDFDGCRYAASLRERTRRPDVQRHFGLQDDACGFSATVEVPPATTLADLSGARVLGGHTAAEAGAPLRLAPAVQAAIARAVRA
ncbi:ABC transporter ATP-binding protein [Luteimonas wenzhouensis]|uniref:ABC transporter ATP-binding protein n=1 Tax=Luteimonas wenzhouensis TaxID=2599615 RepID=A0A5C5TUR2_9GAMM|nr:ABC transporter ATP-binding protein [Luteimonas wenzhouensis]TWT16930.1 ABC transporter ATP-binding protein [Luteimonas wenzhouensis]